MSQILPLELVGSVLLYRQKKVPDHSNLQCTFLHLIEFFVNINVMPHVFSQPISVSFMSTNWETVATYLHMLVDVIALAICNLTFLHARCSHIIAFQII